MAATNSSEEITMQIDSEAAKAYKSAAPEEKKKIELLFGALVKEVASGDRAALKQLMDDISEKAQSRGLTPEILEAILGEE